MWIIVGSCVIDICLLSYPHFAVFRQADVIQYPVPDSLDHLVPGLDPVGVDLLSVGGISYHGSRAYSGGIFVNGSTDT